MRARVHTHILFLCINVHRPVWVSGVPRAAYNTTCSRASTFNHRLAVSRPGDTALVQVYVLGWFWPGPMSGGSKGRDTSRPLSAAAVTLTNIR